jgi:hypothetical protein
VTNVGRPSRRARKYERLLEKGASRVRSAFAGRSLDGRLLRCDAKLPRSGAASSGLVRAQGVSFAVHKKPARIRRAVSLGVATLGVATAATLPSHPALAAWALAKAQSLVTCASTAACVTGTNTGSGCGVLGTSTSGIGVTGNSSTSVGVVGSSTSDNGLYGWSRTSDAIEGQSYANDAIFGETMSPTKSGVVGYSPAETGFSA